MKIVYHDEATLILRPANIWISILFGLMIGGFGLLVIGLLGANYHLTCTRESGGQMICRWERTLLGVTLEKESFDDLQGARLRESYQRWRKVYRVVLLVGDTERPLTNSNASGYQTHNRIVEEINTFVQSPTLPQLDVSQRDLSNLWLGIILLGVSSGIVLDGIQTRFTTWTLDRAQGLITRRRETLLGVKVDRHPLSDISGVQVSEARGTRGSVTYRLELPTHDGGVIPLTRWSSSDPSGKEHTAEIIRAFLQH